MLVNLINPALRTDGLKFEFSQIKPYFIENMKPPIPQIALLSGGLQAPEMIDSIEIEIEEKYSNELNNLALLIYKILKFDPNQRGLAK